MLLEERAGAVSVGHLEDLVPLSVAKAGTAATCLSTSSLKFSTCKEIIALEFFFPMRFVWFVGLFWFFLNIRVCNFPESLLEIKICFVASFQSL